ncbi:E3 ubiquitin ligase complex SCF subunit sconC [Physcia stellaris]|nr:E3 ubiquitin ligase complex SCF subunit sconC [Physcia stellaris]
MRFSLVDANGKLPTPKFEFRSPTKDPSDIAKAPTSIPQDAFPQVLPHKAEARQSAEAKPPNPTMDPLEDWQHYPVQREAKALAQDSYWYLDGIWRSCMELERIQTVARGLVCSFKEDEHGGSGSQR